MEEYDMVKQPRNFRRNLFKHQLAAIYKMERIEKEKNIKNDHEIISTTTSIYSDITGYGKTVSIIGLLVRDQMEWDTSEDYIYTFISAVYGSGRIIRYSTISYNKINCNLVIASQSLIAQWKTEIDFSDLKVCVITTSKKAENVNPNLYDVVICSPTMYNKFIVRFQDYAFKRLIYDEPCHTRIPSMKNIVAGFNWLITATPDLLLYYKKSNYTNFLSSLFSSYTDYRLFQNLIIKNDDDFVRLSYSLPQTNHTYHECQDVMYQIVKGIIPINVLEMISAGNIEGAVRYLGGDHTSNILDLIKTRKTESLEEAENKIRLYTRRNNTQAVEKWTKKKDEVLKQLEKLEDRLKDALKNDCNICLQTIEKPVLAPCCQNIFCGKCIFKWLENKDNCPLCRKDIDLSSIIYIDKEGGGENKSKFKNKVKNKKSKLETIADIINKDGKFIIFSCHDETFNPIRSLLSNIEIKYAEIRGKKENRERIINSFKYSDIKVIFLNSRNNGAGINLQEATDIILYHEMLEDIEKQIIGRANRIGRKDGLRVHHLI